MKPVLLVILCWSLAGQTTANELSKKMADFLTYISGDTTNKIQVELKGSDYDLVEVKVRRVFLPWMGSKVAGIVEKSVNGKIIYIYLGVATEGPTNTVSLQLYNFTESSGVKSFDPEKISKVKPEHLRSEENCVASFEIWEKGLMTGIYPDCRYGNNETHSNLFITYTCDFETVLYPHKTDQKESFGPYVFHKTPGETQPDYPKGYISPCGK